MSQADVIIIDDDPALLDSLDILITSAGYRCQSFASAEMFLSHALPLAPCCAIVDIHMPKISGLELQAALNAQAANLPLVFVSGGRSIARAVYAIRAGALDFLEKPFDPNHLLASVDHALNTSLIGRDPVLPYWFDANATAHLTLQQQCILQLLIYGYTTREIADILDIPAKTVETLHRSVMPVLQAHACAASVPAWFSQKSGGGGEGAA